MDIFNPPSSSDGLVSISGQPGDAQALVKFFPKSVIHGFKSQEAGHPVYMKKDYISVMFPGERDTVIREVKPTDKMRWPRQWAAYEAGAEQEVEGTPILHLFPNDPEIADNLGAVKIKTIEQLAGLSDTQLLGIGMGAREFQNRAKRFLEGAAAAGKYHRLERELAERDRKIEQLAGLIEALQKQVNGEDGPKRKGRPPTAE